jgi:hypothetical protein
VTIVSTDWIIMTFLKSAESENEYFIVVMNVVYRINKREKWPDFPPLYLQHSIASCLSDVENTRQEFAVHPNLAWSPDCLQQNIIQATCGTGCNPVA